MTDDATGHGQQRYHPDLRFKSIFPSPQSREPGGGKTESTERFRATDFFVRTAGRKEPLSNMTAASHKHVHDLAKYSLGQVATPST